LVKRGLSNVSIGISRKLALMQKVAQPVHADEQEADCDHAAIMF